jgi:indolepyruvate ferredoxin oxidoreductase beta subunit
MDWKINKPLSFILVGVGGQGTILASDLLAEVGLRLGYDVKKAEVHGMSQRGGSVVSNLRWAAQVYSPIVPRGTADVLVAFEKLEAVRFSDFLRPGGLALVNNFAIVPVTVNAAGSEYPEDDRLHEALRRITPHEEWVDGVALAEAAGNSRASNVVMIGALAGLLDLPDDIVCEAIEVRVPARYVDLNKRAYKAGREAVSRR